MLKVLVSDGRSHTGKQNEHVSGPGVAIEQTREGRYQHKRHYSGISYITVQVVRQGTGKISIQASFKARYDTHVAYIYDSTALAGALLSR